MATTQSTSDESLVARIIQELEDQPQARMLLLQTLLTEEFLLLPSRMDRVEESISSLTVEVRALGEQVNSLANTVMFLSQRVDSLVRLCQCSDEEKPRSARLPSRLTPSYPSRLDSPALGWF